jgi:hypothetical protein
MKINKKLAVFVAAFTVVVIFVVVAVFSRGAHVNKSIKDSKESADNTAYSASETLPASTVENGDSFNTDELDTGVIKSTAGLGMGAYSENPTSTEVPEPETYAETDAEGKNLTEPVQTVPTVEKGLSESEYGKIAESVQQQNNAVINDTSSDGSIGKEVDDAVSAIQAAELDEYNKAMNSPEAQRELETAVLPD